MTISASATRLSRERLVVVTILVVSAFIVTLNEMIMGVALPSVMADLGISATTGQWLTTGYMLTMAIVIPTTGFVMERFSTRAVFIAAMGSFTLGTMVAIVAPGFEVLLAGRIVQAAGTAMMMPLLLTTAMTVVPVSGRGRMMAVISIVTSIAPAVGPLVAGAVLVQLSWRWLFILVLPFAVAALVIGAVKIRLAGTRRATPPDGLSIGLSALGFAALVYGLSSIGETLSGHATIPPWITIAVGVAAVTGFVARQLALQRTDSALLDLRTFGDRGFRTALIVMTFMMMSALGVSLVLPLLLQSNYGFTSLQAGLLMAPGGAAIALVSVLVGRLYDSIGPRPLLIPGAVVVTSSLWFLSTLQPDAPFWVILAAYVLMCTGQSFMWTPLFAVALGSLKQSLLPHGSAIINTVQQLVGAAGTAILISALAATTAMKLDQGAGPVVATAAGAQAAFVAAGVITLLALAASLFVRTPPEIVALRRSRAGRPTKAAGSPGR